MIRFSRLVQAGVQLELELIDLTVDLTSFAKANEKAAIHKRTKQVQTKLAWVNKQISRVEKQLQTIT